jgi:hypothetical protein
MRCTLKRALLCLALVATTALAADAGDRRFIRDGMSEGEVLMKIGRPDSESEDSGGGAKVKEKRWVYFPAPGDSQTLTTITIREGKVQSVRREIAR